MNHSNTFMLSIKVFLDQYNQCYRNIVVVNEVPRGPLGNLVRRLNLPNVSPFQKNSSCYRLNDCVLALKSLCEIGTLHSHYKKYNSCRGSNNNLMCDEELPDLFSFLLSSGYKIDTSITKLWNTGEFKKPDDKIICFVTYNEPLETK